MKIDVDKYLWRITNNLTRYRNRAFVVCGVIFVVLYFSVVNTLERSLRAKEGHDVAAWVADMESISNDTAMGNSAIPFFRLKRHPSIPFVLVDERNSVVESNGVSDDVVAHPDRLLRTIRLFSQLNEPIHFQYIWSDTGYTLYYGNSLLLESLRLVPYMQFIVALVFVLMAYIAIRSMQQKEQNQVWVGLAKETAHQLGTPISSLIGWVEYLREQGVEEDAVAEMARDLTQLTKVTDRFSKIGSDTQLNPANVNEVVERVVHYFAGRTPRSVTIDHDGFVRSPLYANINIVLIEWVVENLIKNAIDALQGAGKIEVKISATDNDVMIDVSDSGKGIPKSSWHKIFDAGYTTKVRGWGLGLSLSRRIVEDYHNGKSGVESSTVGAGTKMRVTLKRYFEV